jgi:hypothetical protein
MPLKKAIGSLPLKSIKSAVGRGFTGGYPRAVGGLPLKSVKSAPKICRRHPTPEMNKYAVGCLPLKSVKSADRPGGTRGAEPPVSNP